MRGKAFWRRLSNCRRDLWPTQEESLKVWSSFGALSEERSITNASCDVIKSTPLWCVPSPHSEQQVRQAPHLLLAVRGLPLFIFIFIRINKGINWKTGENIIFIIFIVISLTMYFLFLFTLFLFTTRKICVLIILILLYYASYRATLVFIVGTMTCSKLVGYSVISEVRYMYSFLNQAATLWDCHLSCTNDDKCSAFNWYVSIHVCYWISVSEALPVNLVKSKL